MKPLKILIVDDHELIRDGIAARLGKHPGWTICGEACNGRDAIAKVRELQPDVAVIDVSMPGLNGIEATRQICKERPETQVLILTMQESEGVVRDALAAGARGFVLKSDASRLLEAGVESLAAGAPFFSGKVSSIVLGGYLDPSSGVRPASVVNRLSPREREIAQLLAESHTNKEVAATLGVSVKTIDAHRANIMRKLNLHSISELVRWMIREGLMEP